MIEYPEIDRYASLDSPLHRFDPRVKIIAFLFLIFSIVLIPDLRIAFVGLFFAVFMLVLSRIPLTFVLSYLKWVAMFILSFLVILMFTFPGKEIARFYFLSISAEGLYTGSLITVRAFSAVILLFPMIGTMKFDTTIKALDRLKVPNSLVQMLMFTYRYIFVFVAEFQRIWMAMVSRGFKLRTTIYALRTIGKALGMLFVRSYERAERVYRAMRSRGYTGYQKTLVKFEIRMKDYLLAVFIMGFAISLHVVSLVGM
ncbi:MAG: cobalt ECF transporter T component CbiQ [Methanophagales archaeon]|nr:cobalt ECF transporter T component CbiQ [Methanophagales archaeon]MCW3141192.1 cobalt ECF transporter T component CbiQ [Methanophagales archaeon]